MLRRIFLVAVVMMAFAQTASAQLTKIIVSQPPDPSGSGWVPITKVIHPVSGQSLQLGNVENGSYVFYTNSPKLWLTDNNGNGSLHTFDHSNSPEAIVVYVQSPVTYSGWRAFFYYTTKNGVITNSPLTYLVHTTATFP